jgi:hypothetical protein
MADKRSFDYLKLLRRENGLANLSGGGPTANKRTLDNRTDRTTHSTNLRTTTESFVESHRKINELRKSEKLLELTAGIPLLLEVDPALDIDKLRHYFNFEIVSEEEEGGFVNQTINVRQKIKTPLRLRLQGRLVLEQVFNSVGKALLAEHDVHLSCGSNLLEYFEFTKSHQGWVVGQELCRVGLAAHGRRFLAAGNQVGFGSFLGFGDSVHQILHIAWQDHVLDTHRTNF